MFGIIGLACAAVVGLLLLLGFLQCPTYGRRVLQRAFRVPRNLGPRTQFNWFMAATERLPTGQLMDDVVYQCEDCVKVDRRSATFPADSDAQKFAEQQLALGNIVSLGTTLPGGGRRVVLQYGSTKEFSIMLQCGRKVRLVESDSLLHALEFEKRSAINCSQPSE